MQRWIIAFAAAVGAVFSSGVQAQGVHNHNQYHGLSASAQANPPTVDGLHVEFRWRDQATADIDGHVQLPSNEGPYIVTNTANFSRPDQPFANGPQDQRVYPSQSGVQFNNGAAFAFHSGDQGGGAPTGVGCTEPAGGSCEVITIAGQVPTGQYGVGIHNFNFFNIPNSAADYDIIVHASNGTAYIEGHETHLSANSVSGRLNATGDSQLETVNFMFTGNPNHAIGVNELISTHGFSIAQDKLHAEHKVVRHHAAAEPQIIDRLPPLIVGNMLAAVSRKINSGFSGVLVNQAKQYHFDRNARHPMTQPSWALMKKMVQAGLAMPARYEKSVFHQFTSPDNSNVKFTSADGHSEWVYDKNRNLILDGPDAGSYNYSTSNLGHAVMDIGTWVAFGNNENDTTSVVERAEVAAKGLSGMARHSYNQKATKLEQNITKVSNSIGGGIRKSRKKVAIAKNITATEINKVMVKADKSVMRSVSIVQKITKGAKEIVDNAFKNAFNIFP